MATLFVFTISRFQPHKEILAYLSGKIKLHKIKVLVGDSVEIILGKYGGKVTNRITHRL